MLSERGFAQCGAILPDAPPPLPPIGFVSFLTPYKANYSFSLFHTGNPKYYFDVSFLCNLTMLFQLHKL